MEKLLNPKAKKKCSKKSKEQLSKPSGKEKSRAETLEERTLTKPLRGSGERTDSQERTGTKEDSKDTEEEVLEKQEFYHGFRPRRDIAALLKQPGDFLVRASDNRTTPDIVISVMNERKECNNLRLRYENGMWELNVLRKLEKKKIPRFATVSQLVQYYKVHALPGKTLLKAAIPRPLWLIKHDQIVFNKDRDLIGSGFFCHVYKGIYKQTADSRITVAVKICHQGNESDQDIEECKEARKAMMGEAKLMSQYSHEFVIQLFGVACDHPPVLIVMELCPGGNLLAHLEKQGDRIDLTERLVYAQESALGVAYLHSKGCIHRDLATRNCLISAQGTIKISDFGLSRLASEMNNLETGSQYGAIDKKDDQVPVRWSAPESLKRPRIYSMKTDVWAYCVLLYEIFTNGDKPYPKDPPKKVATKIRRGEMPAFPATTLQEVKELAKDMWQVDSSLRPDMQTVSRRIRKIAQKYRVEDFSRMTVNRLAGVTRIKSSVREMDDDEPKCVTIDRESTITTGGNTEECSPTHVTKRK